MKVEVNIQQSNQLKSIAILMMLFLHLFNRDYHNLFTPLLFVGGQPLSYYISLFCDSCVPIFAFVSGYGLYYKFQTANKHYVSSNLIRIRNLYINFWIILILFVVCLGYLTSKEGYPGNFQTFFVNLTAVNVTYNGAWWFLTTYILFVLSSNFWFSLMDKIQPYFYFSLLLVLYIVGFYFRIYKKDVFVSPILNWLHVQTALYFCTLLQFMLGAFVLKYKLFSYFNSKLKLNNNYILVTGIVSLIVLHGLIPNFIIAPFIGIVFVFLFCQLKLSNSFSMIVDFFTPHSTNIWLIHMFFYLIYSKNFIYSFNYVLPIYMVLLLLCICSSYLINYLNNAVHKLFFAK